MPSLYDPNLNYIFVHIPKCGGMSLTEYLEARSEKAAGSLPQKGLDVPGLKPAFDANNKAAPKDRNWQIMHARARDFRTGLGARIYDKAFVFSVVRNPWTRLGSLYHFIRMKPNNPHHAKTMTQTIDEWAHEHCERFPSVQTAWLTDLQGNMIVDNVVRFENLAAGIADVSDTLFGESEPLPRNNVSANGSTPLRFEPKTIEVIRKVYARDFEYLNYPDYPEQ